MSVTETVMPLRTADDLFRLNSERRYELIEGKLVELPLTSENHSVSGGRLFARAGAYALTNDRGEVYLSEAGFVLKRDPDTVIAPDFAFTRKERLNATLSDSFATVIPDLVLEVRSPGDTKREAADKVGLWLNAGVRMVWELDPKARILSVHRLDEPPKALGVADTLSGEDVLPEFSLPVSRLFRDPGAF